MKPVPDWLCSTPIAYRGLHDSNAGIPENSLAAFDAAAMAGYPVELDVQLSADGVVMVFHDTNLDRLTAERGPIGARTVSELERLLLLGTTEAIPTFSDILRIIAGRVPVIVEIKNDRNPVGPLEAATHNCLKEHGTTNFTVQSFRPESLAWYVAHAPEIVRGQLAWNAENNGTGRTHGRPAMLRRLMFDYLSRPDYISYDIAALPYPPVARARRAGLPVIGYTAHSETEWLHAMPYVDGIIFEGFRPTGNMEERETA